MLRYFFLMVFFIFEGNCIAQENDSSKIHLTLNYSNGLCGLIQNNHADNIYYSKYFTQASAGIRKEVFGKDNFAGLFLTYTNRGIRRDATAGNPFLPGIGNDFDNHYFSLQFMGGFYIKKGWYFKEYIGFDYLFSSNQYNFDDAPSFRGVKRFNITYETSLGSDLPIFKKMNGFIELFLGATFLKPHYFYIGPRIGFYFKERDLIIGKPSL